MQPTINNPAGDNHMTLARTPRSTPFTFRAHVPDAAPEGGAVDVVGEVVDARLRLCMVS